MGSHSPLEKVLKMYVHALKERFYRGLLELTSNVHLQDQNVPVMLITSREANSHEYSSQNKICS